MQTTWCASLGLCWLPRPLIDCARRCAQVKSIFPDLDSIFYMSERFYNLLSSCNHGYHPLISKQKSDHSGFLQLLIAKLKEMRRKQWHARASDATASPIPEGAVRLEVTLSLSDDELRAQVHGSSPSPHSRALRLSHPRPPLAAVAGAASVCRGIRRRPGGSPEDPCARGGRRRDSGHQPAQRRDSGHQQAQRTSTWLSRSSRSRRGNHHGDQPAAASERWRRQRRGRRLRLAPSVVAAGQRVCRLAPFYSLYSPGLARRQDGRQPPGGRLGRRTQPSE